jgi:hypothetical protein
MVEGLKKGIGAVIGSISNFFKAAGFLPPTIENVVKTIYKLGLAFENIGFIISGFITKFITPFAGSIKKNYPHLSKHRLSQITGKIWWRISPETRAIESYPLWHSGSTGASGVEADLVYIHKGGERDLSEKDLAGKAVLASRGHRFINLLTLTSLDSSYELAQEKQAAGYISFFTNTPGNAYQLTQLTMPTGKPGSVPYKVPGFSIGKEDARYLKGLLKKDKVRVKMYLDANSRPAMRAALICLRSVESTAKPTSAPWLVTEKRTLPPINVGNSH